MFRFHNFIPKAKAFIANPRGAWRGLSSSSAHESYSTGTQVFHWVMGGSMGGAVATVLLAQNTKVKEDKAKYMFIHKSLGTLAALLLLPRIAFRMGSKAPGPIPGSGKLEHLAGVVTHFILYGFIVFLPVSGVVMGYFGGNGLPFFFTTIKGAQGEEKKPDLAKQSYQLHKLAGQAFEYLVPLHVGAAFFHAIRGQSIFPRILGILKK